MTAQIFTDTSDHGMRQIAKTHFFDSLTCFSVLPVVTVHESDIIRQVMSPNMPNWLTNAVFDCQADEHSINELIEGVIQSYTEHNVIPYWRVCPDDTPASLADDLIKKGFELRETQIAMSVDLAKLDESITLADNITLERIASADELRTKHPSFMQDRPGMAALMRELFDYHGYSPESVWQHYVGLLDGKPVAYGSAFYATGVVGIYNVGTFPEARKRGIGSAITKQLLLDARDRGYRVGTLQSSQMGLNMYQKMGFKRYFDIDYYAPASPE